MFYVVKSQTSYLTASADKKRSDKMNGKEFTIELKHKGK